MSSKLHFINHYEKITVPVNSGDWMTSPYHYFLEFFSQYQVLIHSIWTIHWNEIESTDVVIVGGGGLIDNSDALNQILNRLLKHCKYVVFWGVGTHRYSENNFLGKKRTETSLELTRAPLVGIRDYKHPSGLRYVPCPSCMHSAFNARETKVNPSRTVGTITSALEKSFAIQGVQDSISNSFSLNSLVDYILTSKVILTSSYHGAFWSMLLQRKVALPKSRMEIEKYLYFRHPVAFLDQNSYDEVEILQATAALPEIGNFLAESKLLTYLFFIEVRELISKKLRPNSTAASNLVLAKRVAQLEFSLVDLRNEILRHNRQRSEGRPADNERPK